jgi:PPOX class probable F420-dependent enzyme
MDAARMRARVRDAAIARLATVSPARRPHIVPCCFVLERDTVYSAVDGKPKSTNALARLDNIRAHPVASVIIDHYEPDWEKLWWVRLDGDARLLEAGAERDDALDLLIAKYEQYTSMTAFGLVIAVDVVTWRAWP